VLRRVAEKLGLPKHVMEKSKKAIQYTTGVNKALKKLAKKQKMSQRDYLYKIF
jgi:asparagine synthetase B (glutamine-hydrolysing)